MIDPARLVPRLFIGFAAICVLSVFASEIKGFIRLAPEWTKPEPHPLDRYYQFYDFGKEELVVFPTGYIKQLQKIPNMRRMSVVISPDTALYPEVWRGSVVQLLTKRVYLPPAEMDSLCHIYCGEVTEYIKHEYFQPDY